MGRSQRRQHRAGRHRLQPGRVARRVYLPHDRLRDRLLELGVELRHPSSADLRSRDRAAVPVRDERQRAARALAGHLGHVLLLPSRLQEHHLVRQHRHRSVGLHEVHGDQSVRHEHDGRHLQSQPRQGHRVQPSRPELGQPSPVPRVQRQLPEPLEGTQCLRRIQPRADAVELLPDRGSEQPGVL